MTKKIQSIPLTKRSSGPSTMLVVTETSLYQMLTEYTINHNKNLSYLLLTITIFYVYKQRLNTKQRWIHKEVHKRLVNRHVWNAGAVRNLFSLIPVAIRTTPFFMIEIVFVLWMLAKKDHKLYVLITLFFVLLGFFFIYITNYLSKYCWN